MKVMCHHEGTRAQKTRRESEFPCVFVVTFVGIHGTDDYGNSLDSTPLA